MRALSYISGSSDQPLIGQTIGDYFDFIVEKHPEQTAIVSRHQNVRLTYEELAIEVNKCAKSLLSIELKRGDRVGIWSPNCVEWLIVQLATSKLGIILVNINPAYRLNELEYALKNVQVKALIIADKFKTSDYAKMIYELVPELKKNSKPIFKNKRLPNLQSVISLAKENLDGIIMWQEFIDMGNEIDYHKVQKIQQTLNFDDPINIQFTSGTTGRPKGATLSHHNILNNADIITRLQNITHKDKIIIPVPLYHCFGMVLGNLGCITKGATMVYPSDSFSPELVLQAVEEEKGTSLYGVPTMFFAQLNHPDFKKYDLSSLRTGIMAGALCPAELMKRVQSEMNMHEVEIGYGMTETSPISTQTRIDAPFEKRISTVGQVLPHTEIKIIHPETGQVVPLGEPGELCTRGYCVMIGYWGDEEKTKESIDASRWMHSGDLATMDADGYINIVGRIKDMIIRGGENIYPKVIEEFLYTHKAINEVKVVGVPDDKYGEQVCAWIELKKGKKLTENQVKEFCRGKIAHYKIPHYVLFVNEFPMTVTGKIRKVAMREKSIEMLGLKK